MTGWRRFLRNRLATASAVFLLLIGLLAAAAPWVARYSYEEQNIEHRLETASASHWMGTDGLGRDLWSRVIYGARLSLLVGVVTALGALVVGTAVGAWAGYKGGWIDHALMRVVDLFLVFPSILLAILLGVVLGRGVLGILIAIGTTAWVTQARLVRGQVLQLREQPFIEAARSVGARSGRVMWSHILPNLWGPVLVSLTLQIPSNILAESFLSFIGLGIQPPASSWGTLASEGFRSMRSYPHLILFPGSVLFLTLLAFNYLGDGLRDLLDPKTRQEFTG